ncbi:NUDIX domain-containing protein [Actinocatenispora sera]|uniref:NUDIX hydrolase n=1 Tax=Actinocatenispora sera TaxID=390989 RepID=UPI003400FF76
MPGEPIDQWTGRHACALEAALRLTQEQFAAKLGAGRRTVTDWHKRPDMVITKGLQAELDRLFESVDDGVRARFAAQLGPDAAEPDEPEPIAALTVAIAVVFEADRVLIVCRRDEDSSGITWQFPAGIVKPGSSAQTTAVRETLAETGVRCVARKPLGGRIHPVTRVRAEYFMCEYLAGEAENRDPAENVDVIWAPRASVTRFIPADRIFRPVLDLLEGKQ